MADETEAKWAVRPVKLQDWAAWGSLYRAYGAGAGYGLDDSQLDRVWSWITDPEARTECVLLHVGEDARPVGLAHYRPFEIPLNASIGCYLDDLFVDERHRGRGGARTLLEHLSTLAATNGWTTVRWTTGVSNPAQTLYDTLATRSPVVTFNMDPTPVRHGHVGV